MTVSATFKAAAYAQQTSEVFLKLLTIEHDDLASPIRVVDNTENIESNGETYLAAGFDVKLPDDDGRTTLSVCNVDRVMVQAIRSIDSSPTISLSVIMASDPDTIEVGPFVMQLVDVGYDAFTISGTLSFDDFLIEPYPGDTFSPGQFKGLF